MELSPETSPLSAARSVAARSAARIHGVSVSSRSDRLRLSSTLTTTMTSEQLTPIPIGGSKGGELAMGMGASCRTLEEAPVRVGTPIRQHAPTGLFRAGFSDSTDSTCFRIIVIIIVIIVVMIFIIVR
eukprot:4114982-Pyramimonas_sp.AAC.1